MPRAACPSRNGIWGSRRLHDVQKSREKGGETGFSSVNAYAGQLGTEAGGRTIAPCRGTSSREQKKAFDEASW